jgi:hypothetical protein
LKEYERLREEFLQLTKPPRKPLSGFFIFYQEQVRLHGKKENLQELGRSVGK